MTAVVVDSEEGKDYRSPVAEEVELAATSGQRLPLIFNDVPIRRSGGETGRGCEEEHLVRPIRLDEFGKLFISRQLAAIGTFIRHTRCARKAIDEAGYSVEWTEAICAYLAVAIDRLADAGSAIAHWQPGNEFNVNTFQRFALPMAWDFSEAKPLERLGVSDWWGRRASTPSCRRQGRGARECAG
jgi:putative DNA methylase